MLFLSAAAFLSCEKENLATPLAHPSQNVDADILVFSQKDDLREFISSFNNQEDPYAWKNNENPTFVSLWDKYILAEREASNLKSFEEAADFKTKWKNDIRILEDGTLEPLYEFYFQNALVGKNGIYKVGPEYRRLFHNGEVISNDRSTLEGLPFARTLQSDENLPEGARFEPINITTKLISDTERSSTLSTCTNSKKVNGKWHRTQGKLKGGVYNFDCPQFGGCPRLNIETFIEIVTKKQKKTWGIWVNGSADDLWGNGSLDFVLNGSVFNSTYVSKYVPGGSTLFVSKSEGPFSGDHLDAGFDNGTGFHRTRRGTEFDRSCNTSF